MTGVYWIGFGIVAALSAVTAGVVIIHAWMNWDIDYTTAEASRRTLAALFAAPVVTVIWPLAVPVLLLLALVLLWRAAELPRPRLRRRRKPLTDQAYIEQLERELGIGGDR